MIKLTALTGFVLFSLAVHATGDPAPTSAAECAPRLSSVRAAWRRAKERHYWLAHTRAALRSGLRSPRARSAFNARQLTFEEQMRPRAIENANLITHAREDHLNAGATSRGATLVVIQNARRHLYVRGHGLTQIPKGWAVFVGADQIVDATFDPAGAARLPPQDPLAVTYW